MKKSLLTKALPCLGAAAAIWACSTITNITMPSEAKAGEAFEVRVASIVETNDYDGNHTTGTRYAHFAVRLPEGWTLTDAQGYTQADVQAAYKTLYEDATFVQSDLNISHKVMVNNDSKAAYDQLKHMGTAELILYPAEGSGLEVKKVLMIPNNILSDIANTRYNTDKYTADLGYKTSYLGYTSYVEVDWDDSKYDRAEAVFHVLTPANTPAKDYRLEVLTGDEENSYYQYVPENDTLLYPNATYSYSTATDNDLFENGTFNSADAGWYDAKGACEPNAEGGKELNNSIHKVYEGNTTIKITDPAGVETVIADDNAPVEYFNLQGHRVANPANGIFIRRQGNKTQKVAIK